MRVQSYDVLNACSMMVGEHIFLINATSLTSGVFDHKHTQWISHMQVEIVFLLMKA